MVLNVLNMRTLFCALIVLVVRFFVNEILSSFCHARVYVIGEKELILLSLTRKVTTQVGMPYSYYDETIAA